MFPVIGSGVLFGFFLLFKFFSKEYINYLLTAYFAIFGIGSVGTALSQLLALAIPAHLVSLHALRLRIEKHDKSSTMQSPHAA